MIAMGINTAGMQVREGSCDVVSWAGGERGGGVAVELQCRRGGVSVASRWRRGGISVASDGKLHSAGASRARGGKAAGGRGARFAGPSTQLPPPPPPPPPPHHHHHHQNYKLCNQMQGRLARIVEQMKSGNY